MLYHKAIIDRIYWNKKLGLKLKVACRVREYEYYMHRAYRYQFTFRKARPFGRKIEYQEMVAHLNFYAFWNKYKTGLVGIKIFNPSFLPQSPL